MVNSAVLVILGVARTSVVLVILGVARISWRPRCGEQCGVGDTRGGENKVETQSSISIRDSSSCLELVIAGLVQHAGDYWQWRRRWGCPETFSS